MLLCWVFLAQGVLAAFSNIKSLTDANLRDLLDDKVEIFRASDNMIDFKGNIPFNPKIPDYGSFTNILYLNVKMLREHLAFVTFNSLITMTLPTPNNFSILRMYALSQSQLSDQNNIIEALVALKKESKSDKYPNSLQKVRRIIEFPGEYDNIYKIYQVELEYSLGFRLDSLIISNGENFSLFKEPNYVQLLFRDILKAVNFLHENDIIHNNLYLSNIIYKESGIHHRGYLIGYSRLVYIGKSSEEFKQYWKMGEAYSLGAMFIALLNFRLPQEEYLELIDNIQAGKEVIATQFENQRFVSDIACELIRGKYSISSALEKVCENLSGPSAHYEIVESPKSADVTYLDTPVIKPPQVSNLKPQNDFSVNSQQQTFQSLGSPFGFNNASPPTTNSSSLFNLNQNFVSSPQSPAFAIPSSPTYPHSPGLSAAYNTGQSPIGSVNPANSPYSEYSDNYMGPPVRKTIKKKSIPIRKPPIN